MMRPILGDVKSGRANQHPDTLGELMVNGLRTPNQGTSEAPKKPSRPEMRYLANDLTDCMQDRLKSIKASSFCSALPESMDSAARRVPA